MSFYRIFYNLLPAGEAHNVYIYIYPFSFCLLKYNPALHGVGGGRVSPLGHLAYMLELGCLSP